MPLLFLTVHRISRVRQQSIHMCSCFTCMCGSFSQQIFSLFVFPAPFIAFATVLLFIVLPMQQNSSTSDPLNFIFILLLLFVIKHFILQFNLTLVFLLFTFIIIVVQHHFFHTNQGILNIIFISPKIAIQSANRYFSPCIVTDDSLGLSFVTSI